MVAAKKSRGLPAPEALRVLHVASEIYPLVKTGGLADVVAALPEAQEAAGADVRVLVPGIPAVLQAMERQGAGVHAVADVGPAFGAARIRLLKWRLDVPSITLYAIDAPLLYRRQGGPYHAPDGQEWPDNLQRFALLGWVACQLAQGGLDPDWVPQIVHAHDWHAGMACLYLKAHPHEEVRSVFTIHNLAYQGLFPMADQALLGLSSKFLSSSGLEYHGHLSMMKAGLKFADRITTVSPTYAREIATDAYGAGLDGVIRSRGGDVRGILNGMDQKVWNPATDAALAKTFDADDLRGKAACKQALQEEFKLEVSSRAMVLVAISRLTSQKGLDLLLQAWPRIQSWGLQCVIQGTGDKDLEAGFRDLAQRHPGQVAVHMGYDEERAHRLMAGADGLLVPSRFEPCGLTQLYAMRYGTLPIVRATGGLADTVTDLAADPEHATGFQFRDATVDDLVHAIHRAHEAWHQRTVRQRLIANAMRQDFSWAQPARDYLTLYRDLLCR